METKSSGIHTDEMDRGTEDRKERDAPISNKRQQRNEEHKQMKAAGILRLPFSPQKG